MQNKISFQQIDYFLTVAEVLSFTDASRLLYISQPALSKQIGALEKELGFSLFVRDRRHVALTPAGASLYRDWNELSKRMEDSLFAARAISSQTSGILSIGCSDTFDYSDVLPFTVRRYIRNYPQIDVNIESHSFRTLRDGLMSDKFDVIVTPYFELDGLSDVQWLRLKDIPLSIIIPTSNPLCEREHIRFRELSEETFILISPNDSLGGINHTQELCRRSGFRMKNARHVPNVSSLELAVKNGLGIAVCNSKLFENDSNCRIFPLDIQPDDSFLVAVWKKHTAGIPLKLFTTLLQEHFSHPVR